MSEVHDIASLLRVVRGAEDDQESPALGSVPVEHSALAGEDVTFSEQAGEALRQAARSARRRAKVLSDTEGSFAHWAVHTQPPSIAGQVEYAKSKLWVPPGHEGKTADKLGTIYHWSVGVPGVALGNLISAVFSRPFALAWAVFVLGSLAVILAAVMTAMGIPVF